jgi:hypothetical protein
MLGAATGDDADIYSGGIRWRFFVKRLTVNGYTPPANCQF